MFLFVVAIATSLRGQGHLPAASAAESHHEPGSDNELDHRPEVSLGDRQEGAERPTIDARIGIEEWANAVEVSSLTQVLPVAGAQPSQRTRIRLLHAADAIFLAIECLDSEPAEIRATQRKRDARLDPDDRVEFYFDTFLDRRNAYWFQIGAAGSRGDALITKNGARFNKQWDGIWYAKSRVTAQGWMAEVEIPLATMNFDPNHQSWGFNIRRFIRRFTEEGRWASPLNRISFFSIANGGTLHGLTGLKQGLGLTAVPFVVGDARRDRFNNREVATGDLGLDVFYNLTSNFKVSVSFNTDFAETEVDERQVNLTRFPLFFPERRAFFLEDSGNFFFGPSQRGGGRGGTQPFFSRRFGIDASGGEVPLTAAIKFTGQTDRFTVGLMDVQTESAGDLGAKNLFVGRVSMNVLEQSDVGMVWTRGNPVGDTREDTYGVDFNYRTDRFLGDRNLQFSSYVMRADGAATDREEMAYYSSLSYPNDEISLNATAQVVEDNFDPALGFVPRTGIKQYDLGLGYNPRLYSSIRRLRLGLFPRLVTDTGNRLQSASITLRPLNFEFENGDEVGVLMQRRTEVLDESFEIQDGVVVPRDRYDEMRYSLQVRSSSRRVLEFRGDYSMGGFFGGQRNDSVISLTWRPGAWGNFSLENERNDVRLPGGDFVVRIWRARVGLQFSPDLSWSNFIQYDNVSAQAGLNSRIWWIVKPGHDVFLVLNQGWDYRYRPQRTLRPTLTQLTAKISYSLRF